MVTVPMLDHKKVHYRNHIYFGMDAEFFFKDGQKVVPADNLLPQQHRAEPIKEGYISRSAENPRTAVYYDGIQGEFSVEPSTCRAWVLDEAQLALKEIIATAKNNGLSVSVDPAVPISQETLDAANDRFMSGFGCSPSKLQRFGGMPHAPNLDGNTHLTRYAGLHIHLGKSGSANYNAHLLTAEGRLNTVRWLDLFVGNTFVLLEGDLDRERRKVYGKAGEYRDKSYGIEYRTPSSALLKHPVLLNTAFALARTAATVAFNTELHPYFDIPQKDIITAIDTVDKDLAKRNYDLIRRNLATYAKYANELDITENNLRLLERIMAVGVDNFFTGDLVESWNLDSENIPYHGDHTPCIYQLNAETRGVAAGALEGFWR